MAEATADPKAMLFSAAFSLFIFLTYAALVVFKRMAMPRSRARRRIDAMPIDLSLKDLS